MIDQGLRARHVLLVGDPLVLTVTFFKLRHKAKDDPHIPITFIPALTVSFLHFTYLLLHSSRTLGQRRPTQSRRHVRAVGPLFLSLLVLPLCVYALSIQSPHHRHPRGRPLLCKAYTS